MTVFPEVALVVGVAEPVLRATVVVWKAEQKVVVLVLMDVNLCSDYGIDLLCYFSIRILYA